MLRPRSAAIDKPCRRRQRLGRRFGDQMRQIELPDLATLEKTVELQRHAVDRKLRKGMLELCQACLAGQINRHGEMRTLP